MPWCEELPGGLCLANRITTTQLSWAKAILCPVDHVTGNGVDPWSKRRMDRADSTDAAAASRLKLHNWNHLNNIVFMAWTRYSGGFCFITLALALRPKCLALALALALALKPKSLDLGFVARGLLLCTQSVGHGLGLVPCGLVNMPDSCKNLKQGKRRMIKVAAVFK